MRKTKNQTTDRWCNKNSTKKKRQKKKRKKNKTCWYERENIQSYEEERTEKWQQKFRKDSNKEMKETDCVNEFTFSI